MSTCVVCGTDIDRVTAAPDTGDGSERYPPAQTEHGGEIHRFCCSDHKATFQDDPEQFVT